MSANDLEPTHQLRAAFALALAEMYGREVPAYTDLVEVTRDINAQHADGLEPDDGLGSIERITAERPGAIRVGSPKELSLVARRFALLGMHPVGFYDLREAAAKSAVPVVSTAFRPIDRAELARNPFRVFTSMLVTDDARFFGDPALREKIEQAIDARAMFPPELVALIEQAEERGGVTSEDAPAFIREATKAFELPSHAVDQQLYDQIHAVSPVAADIFFGLNINHLTPRVLDIDALHRTMEEDRGIKMKDTIEGPPRRAGGEADVLLRQTSFRSLPEPIRFKQHDGTVTEGTRRVRFGEVEQRGVAMTPAGRALYDDLLDSFDAQPPDADDTRTHAERWSAHFEQAMPKTYDALARQGLAYFEFVPTDKGLAASLSGTAPTALELLRQGHVALRPIVYEDFLPKSAAGIFQSNLGDESGQRSDEAPGSDKDAAWMAEQIGFQITDPYELYAAQQHESLVAVQRAFSLIAVPTVVDAVAI